MIISVLRGATEVKGNIPKNIRSRNSHIKLNSSKQQQAPIFSSSPFITSSEMWEHLWTASGAWEITALRARRGWWHLEGKKKGIHFCFPELFSPLAAAGSQIPSRAVEGDGKSFLAQWAERALWRSSHHQNTWGMQLALHPAQRRENKLLTLLEFGLCRVIPPGLLVTHFFSQWILFFQWSFSTGFYSGRVSAGENCKTTETTPKSWALRLRRA